jgi:hypothetical protein
LKIQRRKIKKEREGRDKYFVEDPDKRDKGRERKKSQ